MWIQDFYSVAVQQTLKKKSPILSLLIGNLFKIFEKKQLKLSDKLIIISKDFQKTLIKWNIKKKKIIFLPNWGNLKQIKINKKKEHIKNRKFRLVYSGTLGLKHNPKIIVDLAEKNPDIEILVSAAGSGFDKLKNLKLTNNIKLISLQSFNKFNKILNSADVFLAMLNEEASKFSVPSKILNYLCAGKPIVLSAPNINLSSKIITQARAGKSFDPNDFKKLNLFLLKLKQNKRLRIEMGKNARKYAEKNFDIKKIAYKFKKIFKTLI